jgi:hypothetical protein
MIDSVVTIEELNTIRKWVRKRDLITYRAVTDITPFTALQANSLAHLRPDWIEWRPNGNVIIQIPATAECTNTKGTPGLGGYVTDRNRPCLACQNTGRTNRFESTPPGSRIQEPQSRRVVLHHGIAEPAIETLKHIFKALNRDAIGIRRQGIQEITQDISQSALDRNFTYNELMRTQLLIHSAHSVELDTIHRQSPFHKQLNRRIIRNSKHDHSEITERVGSKEFLYVVENNAPVSIDTIAELTDLNRTTVRQRLERLEERDRVEVVEKEQVNPGRYKTRFWGATTPATEDFICQYQCGETSDSLRGIVSHEALTHE